ncbi:MAG: four helix bundle protein, partial [Acidobacteriales bacterium]|nr:four helix bundle protein [Terriglobales bacterium]
MWQKSKTLAVQIYELTDNFPRKEIYGLTSQLRRAAVSVTSNIAEGQGRLTTGEFLHFLGQSRGSLELQTQLAISLELRYISKQQLEAMEEKSSEVLRL